MTVYIAGIPVNTPPLDIRVNSPDINGDLVVNLVDVAAFAEGFMGGVYAFRSDYNFDGVLNLIDLGAFASHLGETCP